MFSTKAELPPNDFIEWLFDTYAWYLNEHGGIEHFRMRRLITPTPEWFPVTYTGDHAWAEQMFALMKKRCGLQKWSPTLRLIPRKERLADALSQVRHSGKNPVPRSSYLVDRDTGEVSLEYDEDLLKRPEHFVGDFCAQLARYLIRDSEFKAESEYPGGKECREATIEVGAVFLGYGIFRANSAFVFEKFSDSIMQGHRIWRTGTLGELELSYALAIFSTVLDTPYRIAKKHLAPNPRAFMKVALEDISSRWETEIERLQNIVLEDD